MDDQLPPCLQRLKGATSFEDGIPGESGPSLNQTAYAKASGMISGLETAHLEYLRDHGTPAGRLYGAVLLKASSRVGNDQSFGKLLLDDSKVLYHSGCKGMEFSVSEIARAFIDTGHFMNFRFSLFCKLTAPAGSSTVTPRELDEAVAQLMSSHAVEKFQKGDSNQPAVPWLAFQRLLQNGEKSRSSITKLIESHQPAARIYGGILLLELDKVAGTKMLTSWIKDDTPVTLSGGCVREESTIGKLSERLLHGQPIVMMKNPN